MSTIFFNVMQNNPAETELEDIFTARTANEWMRNARERPDAKKLFGDMWYEGELAIVFGDTGAGKSALAMQIAESIAGGRAFEELSSEPEPQIVAYLDLELGDKQFLKRYGSEAGEEAKDTEFSERLYRVEVNLSAVLPEGCRSFEEYFVAAAERLIKRTNAKVLVVDSISVLARTSESTREGIEVLRGLNRLRREYGLSILVVAHTPRRTVTRPIVLSDMQRAKLFANFADSVFAVGHSRLETNVRYLKQIRSRNGEIVYGGEHVPVFRFSKMDECFLGFWFETYATETYHLSDYRNSNEWQVIGTIKRMHDSGMSLRDIAAATRRSKSAVHRLLHMWHATHEVDDEVDFAPARAEPEEPLSTKPEWHAPPEAYLGERTDNYLIKIGLRPVNRERILAANVAEAMAAAADSPMPEPEKMLSAEVFNAESDQMLSSLNSQFSSEINSLDRMKRVADAYGNVRFVEEECFDGKPRVWYQYRSDGKLRRWERRGYAAIDSPAELGLAA